mmetsp:Transcript_71847/g.160869  ORF Transcript_71847/g.160869 Transcript_71847/m.160869 type:complete len:243 (-) Transcript_71847:1441-2169(-)
MGKRPESSFRTARFSAARFLPCTSTVQREPPFSPTSQVHMPACPSPLYDTKKSMRVLCGGSGVSVEYHFSQWSTVASASSSAAYFAVRSPLKNLLMTPVLSTVMCEAILKSPTSSLRKLCFAMLSLGLAFSIQMVSFLTVRRCLSYMQSTRNSPTTSATLSCTKQVGFSQPLWLSSRVKARTKEPMPLNGRTSEPHQLKPSFTTPFRSSSPIRGLPQTFVRKCTRDSSALWAAFRGLCLKSA